MLYKKELHRQFNISYPELAERQGQFYGRVIDVVTKLSNRRSYPNKTNDLNVLLRLSELEQYKFENDCTYRDIFSTNESRQNFEFFLHWVEELFNYFMKNMGNVCEESRDSVYALIYMLSRLNLGYKWEAGKITRVLDLADAAIINENLSSIEKDQSSENLTEYKKAIEEFLGLDKSDKDPLFYYHALGRLKNVYQRTVSTKIIKTGGPARLKDTKTILNHIFKDTSKLGVEIPRETLEFIKKNIHHDNENKSGIPTPYKFSRNEYIYWWLQINNLIYLIQNSK